MQPSQCPSSFQFPPPPKFPVGPGNNIFSSQVQELFREEKQKKRVLEEIDNKILDLPAPPKIELGDGLAHALGTEAEEILENKYINSKKLQDKTLQNIKEEYNFDDIKDAFDEASIPSTLHFFMVVTVTILSAHVTIVK